MATAPGTLTEAAVNNTPVAPAAPATAPATTTATPAPSTPTTEQPWYSGFKDADLKGYAELNHWKDPEAAARDAREAQKLIGVPKEDLLRVPKDFGVAKPEELDAIYNRLGRPKTAAAHNLPAVGGGDELEGKMAPLTHPAGFSL